MHCELPVVFSFDRLQKDVYAIKRIVRHPAKVVRCRQRDERYIMYCLGECSAADPGMSGLEYLVEVED